MTSIAKTLLSEHFKIGSILWEEAIESALVTANYLNDQNVINELNEIKSRDVRIPSENKSALIVSKQIELFN